MNRFWIYFFYNRITNKYSIPPQIQLLPYLRNVIYMSDVASFASCILHFFLKKGGASCVDALQTIIIGVSKRSGALRQVRLNDDDSRSFTFQWCNFGASLFVRE